MAGTALKSKLCGFYLPIRYSASGAIKDLASNAQYGSAVSINAAGDVVGGINGSGPFVWLSSGGSLIDLKTLVGDNGLGGAVKINDAGDRRLALRREALPASSIGCDSVPIVREAEDRHARRP